MAVNPWLVEDIDAFSFLNCPECNFKDLFENHAVGNHPLSCMLFKESTRIIAPTIGESKQITNISNQFSKDIIHSNWEPKVENLTPVTIDLTPKYLPKQEQTSETIAYQVIPETKNSIAFIEEIDDTNDQIENLDEVVDDLKCPNAKCGYSTWNSNHMKIHIELRHKTKSQIKNKIENQTENENKGENKTKPIRDFLKCPKPNCNFTTTQKSSLESHIKSK